MPAYKSGKKTQITSYGIYNQRSDFQAWEGFTVKAKFTIRYPPLYALNGERTIEKGLLWKINVSSMDQIPSQKLSLVGLQSRTSGMNNLSLREWLEKKVATIRCPRKSTKFRFIAHYKTRYSIVLMCQSAIALSGWLRMAWWITKPKHIKKSRL